MIEMDMPKIEVEESEDQAYAKVVVEPLEKGFGLTIGNCLEEYSCPRSPVRRRRE